MGKWKETVSEIIAAAAVSIWRVSWWSGAEQESDAPKINSRSNCQIRVQRRWLVDLL